MRRKNKMSILNFLQTKITMLLLLVNYKFEFEENFIF